jgi:hypothetical protein
MDGDPGKTVYTCMLNRGAGIEADLTVSILEAGGSGGPLQPAFQGRGFYVAAAGGAAYQNWAHIQQTVQVGDYSLYSVVDTSTVVSTLVQSLSATVNPLCG